MTAPQKFLRNCHGLLKNCFDPVGSGRMRVQMVGRPQSSLNKHRSMILRRERCGVLGDEDCVKVSDPLHFQKSRSLYILFSRENCAGDEDPSWFFLLNQLICTKSHTYILHKLFVLVGMKLMPVCDIVQQLVQVAHHYRKRSICIRSQLQFYRKEIAFALSLQYSWFTHFAELSTYIPLETLSKHELYTLWRFY